MRYLVILLILAIPYTYALTADFDCPETVTQNVEFTCNLEIFDADEVYDFKLDLQKNGENIAKIYDFYKSSFQSSFYYLKEFIEAGSEEDVRVIIEESGNLDGLIKLRTEGRTESFNFSIKVLKDEEGEVEETTEEISEETFEEEIGEEAIKPINESKNLNNKITGVIVLSALKESNEELVEGEKSLVYESKSSKIVKYLSYAFSLFLIFFIFFLIREKL